MDMTKLLAMADKASSEIAARSGGFNRPVKPAVGQSRWRILPPWKAGSDRIFRTFGQHFIKGTDGKIIGAFVCPSASAEEPGSVSCPHCDEVQAVARLTKDDDALKAIREFRAGETYLFNAVRVDGDDKDKAVLLSLPGSVANNYFQTLATYLREGVNILDPDNGHDVIINRTGTGLTTKYSLTAAPKSSPVSKEAVKSAIDIDDYIEKEMARGKTNIGKFVPALTSVARHVGLPSGEVVNAIESVDSMYGTTPVIASGTSAPKIAAPKAPAISTPKADEGRVIDESEKMPWEEGEDEVVSSAKKEDEDARRERLENEALAEIEALESGNVAKKEAAAEAEAPKEAAPAEEKKDEGLEDFLDTL